MHTPVSSLNPLNSAILDSSLSFDVFLQAYLFLHVMNCFYRIQKDKNDAVQMTRPGGVFKSENQILFFL